MSLLSKSRDAGWIACIDFGTALSKVAMVAKKARGHLRSKHIVPLNLTRGEESPFLLPSIVFVTNKGVLFGQEAYAETLRAEDSERRALVSPKQYLSTHEPEDFEARLPKEIDPTGRYSAKDLLRLYLAHLLERAGTDAAGRGLPWPVPMRVARPAWSAARAAHGERTLRELVRDGFALVDTLGARLSASGGVPHRAATKALAHLEPMTADEEESIFEMSTGSASVLEATAVAAGTIRETGRRVVAVADIGAGTSDFGAFMTGLPGRNVLAEIEASSGVLREAGDFLDMQLRRCIMEKARLLSDDPAGRGVFTRVRARARANKETLFTQGVLTVPTGEFQVRISVEEFLADKDVAAFAGRLRDEFHKTLEVAVACAQSYRSLRGGEISVEILLTGGGHALPMVRDLWENPSVPRRYCAPAPDLAERMEDLNYRPVLRQLVVAIGGAVLNLPKATARVHA